MQTIEELFEHELQDIYGAERTLLDVLQQAMDESLDPEIRKAFASHRKETQQQIKRLEKCFRALGRKPEATTCFGIAGLVREKKAIARERPSAELLEFYNIGAAQKVERYEISSYELLIDMAEKLGLKEIVNLLEESLEEEQAALHTLQVIASEFDVTESATVEAPAARR